MEKLIISQLSKGGAFLVKSYDDSISSGQDCNKKTESVFESLNYLLEETMELNEHNRKEIEEIRSNVGKLIDIINSAVYNYGEDDIFINSAVTLYAAEHEFEESESITSELNQYESNLKEAMNNLKADISKLAYIIASSPTIKLSYESLQHLRDIYNDLGCENEAR